MKSTKKDELKVKKIIVELTEKLEDRLAPFGYSDAATDDGVPRV